MNTVTSLILAVQIGITALCSPVICNHLYEENTLNNKASIEVLSPSAILMEASTGTVIYEKNADEMRSPASITKIMTLLLTMEALEDGRVNLNDKVIVSEHASSMGGSQVFLAEGEEQTLDTLLKCIAVSSGNDASVAVAEHIYGSEEAFVQKMNEKAKELKMEHTHFEDCCGLSNSDLHYSSARDVAIMSRELIVNHPEIFNYTQIWMEDITHVTRKNTSTFTLTSTNKLLKQYPYTTGLKTGSTGKAKYCFSATASKDGMDLIAVIMGAPEPKIRFKEAQELLTYGFSTCHIYKDDNHDVLPCIPVKKGNEDEIEIIYQSRFQYLDTTGRLSGKLKKEINIPEEMKAPVMKGEVVGQAIYYLENNEVGRVPIVAVNQVEKADFICSFRKFLHEFLL